MIKVNNSEMQYRKNGIDDRKNKFPLVSVRISSYNHAAFIQRCLDSVARDSYPNKELVIIDDGSQDDTFKIIKAWAENNRGRLPLRFSQQANQGLCRTLNTLVDLCHGEFLVSLASDDMLCPGGIAPRVQYLQSHPHKQAVIGDCSVIDDQDRVTHQSAIVDFFQTDKNRYLTDEGIKRQVVGFWAVPGPALMVRKSIYGMIGKYDENFLIEDWHFYLRMVEKNLLGFIPDTVSFYRMHAANQSQKTKKIKCLWSQIQVAFARMPFFTFRFKLMLIKRIVLCTLAIVKSEGLSLVQAGKNNVSPCA